MPPLGKTKMTTQRNTFNNARDRFQALLQDRATPESQWQCLFAECPFIFSESLPVRIHEDDIRPLARLGRAEPDFLFFPKHPGPLASYGVIELKRADTRLIRIPRKDVLSLSSDANDALAQARKYAIELKATPIVRPDELMVLGNDMHIFVIAGMSEEIAAKVTNEILRTQYEGLLPANCRIVPFDALFRAFESRIPPAVHLLNTWLPQAHATFQTFLTEIEQAYDGYEEFLISDEILDKWMGLEKEFAWMLGPEAHYREAIPPRSEYEIIGSEPMADGRRPLATKAPNPSMFAAHVCTFVKNVILKTREFGIKSSLPADVKELWQRSGAYASD
jgi:hypothetical protein